MPKLTYIEIIQDALLTLNEPKGSTRQNLWKCIQSRHPDHTDPRQFYIRLKKLSSDPLNNIEKNGNSRFRLNTSYKDKIQRRLAKGIEIKKIIKTQATVKLIKKKKVTKKAKKARKSAKKEGEKKVRKPRAKKEGKAKSSEAKGKSTKQKMQAKAKLNKKTQGSKGTQKKVADKKKV